MLSMLSLLGAVAMLVPPAALATSAGDQQYVDPFGSSTTPSSPSSSSQSTATTQATAPSAATASSTSAATVASSTTQPAANGDPAKTLPYTGLDVSLIVGVGLALLASRLALRRTGRRA